MNKSLCLSTSLSFRLNWLSVQTKITTELKLSTSNQMGYCREGERKKMCGSERMCVSESVCLGVCENESMPVSEDSCVSESVCE